MRAAGTPCGKKPALASHQEAIEQVAAVNLAGDDAVALNDLGLTLQLTGDFAAAGAALQGAPAISPAWRIKLAVAVHADALLAFNHLLEVGQDQRQVGLPHLGELR